MAELAKYHRRAQGHRGLNESNENVDLRSMQAFGGEWINSHFSGCQMGLADLRNARFVETRFNRCSVYAANFLAATFQSCEFVECDFEQASFAGTIIRDAYFSKCRFSHGSFAGATLRGRVKFYDCDFRGTDLDFLETDHLEFDSCNLWGARMNLGCGFWNAKFDRKTTQMFASLLARIDPDERIVEYAGDRLPLVKRLMDREDADGR